MFSLVTNLSIPQDSAGLESIQTQNKMFPYLSDILTSLPHSLGLLLEVKASLPEVVSTVESVLWRQNCGVNTVESVL